MSLINNMLKDLEQRDVYNREIPQMLLPEEKPWYKNLLIIQNKLFLFSLAIPFILFLVFFSISGHHTSTQLLPMIDAPATKEVNAPDAIDSDLNWLKPVSISGMSMQIKENITELTFMLNHNALYRLATSGIDTQLTLTIENSQLVSALPTLHYLNSAIERLSTTTQNGNTVFNIVLFPGSKIKYVNLNDNVKNPELVVSIESQANPSARLDNIKTPAVRSMMTQQYQTALAAADTGQYQDAIDSLTSLLRMDPGYTDARSSLVALLLDQGKTSKAQRIVDDGIRLNPEYIPFVELKARILTAQGQFEKALNLLQNVSPPIAENPDYHAFIAALYQRTNKDVLAVNLYRQLLTINPANGNWWFGVGVSLEKTDQPKQAAAAYSRALAQGHLNAESLVYIRNRLQVLEGDKNESA